MRVLHVFGAMDVGGAEMRTLELMEALQDTEIGFDFLTLSGREGTLRDRVTALGGVIHPLPLTPAFPWRLYRLLRRERPEVLDSHVATFSGVLLLVARVAGVPRRIAHFRSDGDGHTDTPRRRLQRAVMTWLIARCATDIVGVSPSSLGDGYRADWAKDPRARVIANGIAPAARGRRGHRDDGVLDVLHVGRPSPEKNRPHAVRVLRALLDAGAPATLSLAGGTGTDAAALEEAIAATATADRVRHLGARSDARALMAAADVVLLTSVREGLPGVVLEALSEGTPVVATDLPGVRFIAERLPGLTVVGPDATEAGWATAVVEAGAAGRDPGVRDDIRRAFSTSEFALDRSVARHVRLYRGSSGPADAAEEER